MRSLTDKAIYAAGMVRVGFQDGDVRYVTRLAAACIRNERARQGKKKFKGGPKRRKYCKHGHPMSGPKANVREYVYGGFTHRCCYQCVIERMEKARKARKAAA